MLEAVALAFERLGQDGRDPGHTPVIAFAEAASSLQQLLAMLGFVFAFAASDFASKVAALSREDPTLSLAALVATARAEGTLDVKGGRARALRGVRNTLAFLARLFGGLNDPNTTPRAAARDAYALALAPYHALPVRLAVSAGLLTLPSRHHFLATLGATERSAADAAARLETAVAPFGDVLAGLDP